MSFSSGRQALLAYLGSLHLPRGSEVIVQGYTCVVVPNAIHAAGLTPVYADLDPQTLNLDPREAEKLITPRTRVIICQHTFGIPADTASLRALCDRHGLLLIEDCAHVLPDDAGPPAIGRCADALLVSFGRDKAISGVAGGAIIVRDAGRAEALGVLQRCAAALPRRDIARLLFYPLLYAIARPLYGIGIGKALLVAARTLRLLPPIVTEDEKHGAMSPLLQRMPGPCAEIALDQLRRLRRINDHRRALTRLYLQACKDRGWKVIDGITADLPLQKCPLFVKNADAVRAKLKRGNIHLDDGWTGCVVCPRSVDASDAGYLGGIDPHAENVARSILSLPTHPGMTERRAHLLLDHLTPHVLQ
ncbi:MAG: DegT/DnrJ/EryC1/StrS aminotransferase [Candidatus Peregrinibacteria bacterium Gr01-1014_25]|nr:MAG: DegT/DnrJ/EryC1/StrS aminotransferase [Candidatus Peregrinibacteria bacterium Gr01-1014_25]